METVVLVVEEAGWDLEALACLLNGRISATQGEFLEISGNNGNAYVCELNHDEPGLYEDWPPELLRKEGRSPFSIDYRNHEIIESIIRDVTAIVPVIVDTNFGKVMRGHEFMSRVDEDFPQWKWWDWDLR